MDDLHKTYTELKGRLLKLTNQEVAQLAGMVLRDSCFMMDYRWLRGFVDELDTEQYAQLLVFMYPGSDLPKTETSCHAVPEA